MISLLSVLLPTLGAFSGVLATQFFLRRKTRAESHKTEAEAVSIEVDTKLKLDRIAENIQSLQESVKDIEARTKRVENQVANTHTVNLRDDIDALKMTQAEQTRQLAEHGIILNELTGNLEKFMTWTKQTIEGMNAA